MTWDDLLLRPDLLASQLEILEQGGETYRGPINSVRRNPVNKEITFGLAWMARYNGESWEACSDRLVTVAESDELREGHLSRTHIHVGFCGEAIIYPPGDCPLELTTQAALAA